MKKLRLDPETLRVESFITRPGARAEGTVHGHATNLWACQTGAFGCYSGTCPVPTDTCDTENLTAAGCSDGCSQVASCVPGGCTQVH